jgi:YidC/Oxa1 family membrane protein insertase
VSFLNPLYHAVAWLLVQIHSGTAHVVGTSAAWSVSVVLLTVAMRLVLFPVFVKQIRSQRAMQAVQPKMKELQAKYKNDKEKLNQEMMALWREHGVNPLSGCLPLLLQIPIFIALFHTLREIKPVNATCNTHLVSCFPSKIAGFPQQDIFSAAHAKLFGIAPLPASFKTSHAVLTALGGHQGSTRALCLILVLIMVATTFLTQRQLLARNGPVDPSQAQVQKLMLYVFPFSFLIYGFFFPVGVLLYWLTTNVWSLGQQYLVIHRMELAGPATPAAVTPSGPRPGAKPQRGAPKAPEAPPAPPSGPAPGAKPNQPRATGNVVLPPGGAITGAIPGAVSAPRPTPKPPTRPSANRSKKKRKGRR